MGKGWAALAVAGSIGMMMMAGCGQPPSNLPVPVLPAMGTPTPVAAAPKPAPAKPKPKTTKKPTTKKPAPKATSKPTASKPKSGTSSAKAPAKAPSPKPPAIGLADLQAANASFQTTQTWNTVIDNKKDGSESTRTKTTTRFQLPAAYRIEVTDSSNSSKNGTRVVFHHGESQAKVKAGGILGIATLTLGLGDGKLLNHNGWRLDQVVLKGVLDRLAGGGYQAQLAGSTSLGGTKLTVLKVTSAQNTLDADIDYELIGFDDRKLVRLWSCYGKSSLGLPQNLIYQLTIERFDTAVSHPADSFRL